MKNSASAGKAGGVRCFHRFGCKPILKGVMPLEAEVLAPNLFTSVGQMVGNGQLRGITGWLGYLEMADNLEQGGFLN